MYKEPSPSAAAERVRHALEPCDADELSPKTPPPPPPVAQIVYYIIV